MGTSGISRRSERKRLILVVEDNDLNREMLRSFLQNDYEVIEAVNGLAGLEQLEARYRDLSLVLLDVYMPECDGFEFLRRMRADARFDTVPVIVATAGGSLEDEIACLELGANDFIVKPYNFETMMNRIGNMIRLRESASIVNELTWDHATRLFSKEYFFHSAAELFANDPDAMYDVICSDIENFTTLSDRYGDDNCDALLRELATRLAAAIPDLVMSGRIGTDTFAFLVDHKPHNWADILPAAAKGLSFANVSVKFGIVECVDCTMPVRQTCNRAISALETVKGRHGVDVALFDDELHRRQVLEQIIRESMEAALEGLQFSVVYQPKHDVRTGKTGGAEALVRWHHPEIGSVSPGQFIPIFERNGFITKLDLFVWEEACRQIKRCQELGLPVVPISVNASRIDFDDSSLPKLIGDLADKYGVDHALLHIELTETAYSDNPEMVVATLSTLKDMGFSTELDDFGAGYSSLVSLNMLPLDVMKLDMSMIRKATELHDFRIVESTINLARDLGLKTVVEGVETEEEAQRVIRMGCDLIQGYYYSKPLSQEDFEAYLASER